MTHLCRPLPFSTNSSNFGMEVPFVDLKAQYRSIKGEIDSAIARVIENAAFVLGPEVETFEKRFAEYIGAKYCVGVNSGTAAIHLALLASKIGRGDEVIVPANSFFASAEAVSNAGALPVFVDVDSVSYNIDPDRIESAITSKTRAILPVHLYGQAADLDAVLEIARRHGLLTIEDAAQAHGTLYRGRKVGTFGRAACFSFYPGKNLGAYGEGGAVVTDDEELAGRIRLLRDHGSARKYHHDIIGFNFRLESLQAAVLAAKLPFLDRWNDLRRDHAAAYRSMIDGIGLDLPIEMDIGRHVYHLYVIKARNRDQLSQRLTDRGIQTGLHYPVPLHLQKAYKFLGYRKGAFEVSERLSDTILSLPMFPELTRDQIQYVCESIKQSL